MYEEAVLPAKHDGAPEGFGIVRRVGLHADFEVEGKGLQAVCVGHGFCGGLHGLGFVLLRQEGHGEQEGRQHGDEGQSHDGLL